MTRAPDSTNTRTIGRNSFWYTFDSSANAIVMLVTSVPVARIMGPQVLGYYIYLIFLTGVAQRLANVGIPATACKYISEYLGRKEPGLAREIYSVTLRQQAMVATAVTAVGFLIVHFLSDPGYRLVSYLIVASMWPSMMNNIPAQANVGAENLRGNVPANCVYLLTYCTLVVSAMWFNWGLVGLASATFVSRLCELAVRFEGVRRWMSAVERIQIPVDVRQRMFNFSRQNLALLALGLIVWDRSEVLFLKHFSGVTEVAFYSLAFSIVNQLLMVPRGLSSAIGTTIFAQYGRDRAGLRGLLENATRYVSLLTIPVFLGIAGVAGPLIHVVYGIRYLPVIPVLWLMAILAIPRAFQIHIENFLQATEHQGFMVRWMIACAIANLLLDWLLIPRFGAVGGALGSGLAQGVAVAGLWIKATNVQAIPVPVRFLVRLCISALTMLLVVLLIGWALPPLPALVAGVPIGALTLGVLLRVSKCFEVEDRSRLEQLTHRLPASLRASFSHALGLLIPTVPAPIAHAAGTDTVRAGS